MSTPSTHRSRPRPRRFASPQDVEAVVELFRMSYERAAAQHERLVTVEVPT